MRMLKYGSLFSLLLIVFMLVACGSTEVNDETNSGGELRVAINAQPPSLDPPMQAETATRDTTNLMFETLVAPNSKYEAVPMLAESIDVSDDSKTYTFHLRKDVTFHNGKEMIAEDVVASMERWMELSTLTGSVFDEATIEAEDDYTVVLQLSKPSALTLDIMAGQKRAAAIMPKEIAENAPPGGIDEYIGTGPYEFVEWKQDQYIHFTKYDDYKSVEEESDGIVGKKEALVDDIYFDIVTDSATRIAGLQTGEYDIAYEIPTDNYEQIDGDPNLKLHVNETGGSISALFYNKEVGIAKDFKIRQAVNAALNSEEIMMAAFSNEDHFWLDSGYMNKYVSTWQSDAGSEFYNQNNPEKAKQYLEDAGYDGEEFRILTTRDNEYMYNEAVVIQDQLKEIGINVTLEVTDWGTVVDKVVNDPGSWDSYVTGISPVSTPPQLQFVSLTFGGGMDEKMTELLNSLEIAPSIEEAQAIWDEIQGYGWEHYLPATVFGGSANLYGSSNKVDGFSIEPGAIFWNTTVSE